MCVARADGKKVDPNQMTTAFGVRDMALTAQRQGGAAASGYTPLRGPEQRQLRRGTVLGGGIADGGKKSLLGE